MRSGTIVWSMATPKQKTNRIGLRLPIISEKTIDAIHHVYAGKKWGEHLTAVRDQLLEENPYLAKFIESQVSKYPRRVHTAMFEVVLGTLSVIEHQALVNTRDTSIHEKHRS